MSTAASSQTPVQGDDQQRHSTAQAASAASASASGEGGDSIGTEYPPQKHAGKAGLGPHYYEQHRATFEDKVHGLREELEGQVKHNEELRQRGHERITGELKEKQRKEEENNTPFHKSAIEGEKTGDKAAAAVEKDKGQVPKEHKKKEYENKT